MCGAVPTNRNGEKCKVILYCNLTVNKSKIHCPLTIAFFYNFHRNMLDKSFVSITREFGDKALGVLDIGYMDSSEQTYSMLSAPLKDFNNKTSIEIAHDAGYIGFIAHPCCQKWLTRKLFGAIQVKELDLGFLTLPNWFKVSLYRLFAVSRSQHCHVFRSYERLVTSIA